MAKELFKADYNIPRILLVVQAITGVKVDPGKTLVIFDEIQETPRGLHCLKYFCENNVFEEYKGAFTEQYVFQQLVSMNISPFYWSRENSPAEIDFAIQTESRVIPVEVKAEENVRAKSMSEYVKSHPEDHLKGLRISMKGYVDQGWMENIPLYAIWKYDWE